MQIPLQIASSRILGAGETTRNAVSHYIRPDRTGTNSAVHVPVRSLAFDPTALLNRFTLTVMPQFAWKPSVFVKQSGEVRQNL
jgi:hypothetical protein